MHAARALHQHHVARLKILLEPAAGGFGVGQKERGNPSRASGRGQMFGIALDAGN